MQLSDQLKLVKYKLDNINELHNRLSDQGRLSTIEYDLLLRNMMEVYEFYHIVKMEKVLWNQADPSIYEQQHTPPQAVNEEPEEEEEQEIEEEIVMAAAIVEAPEEEAPPAVEKEIEPVVERITVSSLSLFNDAPAEEPARAEAPVNEVPDFFAEKVEEPVMAKADETDTPLEWELDEPVQQSEPERQTYVVAEFEAVQSEPEVMVAPPTPEIPQARPSSGRSAMPIETHIAVNDKFIFIRELFGGDFDAYEQTIFDINNLDSRKEAMDYLVREVADRFEWHEKEDVANDFFGLLQKHFDL